MTTKVPTRQFTSGSATDGQVLTADGVGGAAFESLPVIGPQAKAWGYFTGRSGTTAKVAGSNFTSVTRTSTGTYTVTLSTPLTNTNYAIIATGGGLSLATTITTGNTPTKTTSTFSLVAYNPAGPTVVDVDYMYFVIFGD